MPACGFSGSGTSSSGMMSASSMEEVLSCVAKDDEDSGGAFGRGLVMGCTAGVVAAVETSATAAATVGCNG